MMSDDNLDLVARNALQHGTFRSRISELERKVEILKVGFLILAGAVTIQILLLITLILT